MDHPRPWLALAALAALVACSGCWEESHFTPPAETPPPVEATSAATDSTPADAVILKAPPESPSPSEPVVLPDPPDVPPRDAPVTLPDPPAAAPPAPVTSFSTEPDELPPAASPPTTENEQLHAWRAVSQWSLAAAMQAKGLDAAQYDPVLAEATAAAGAIGLELPPLPASDSDDSTEQAVIDSLRDDAGPAVAAALGKKFGAAEQAAAELSIQSRLWLLTYTPQNDAAVAEAAAARQAAQASGLPAELWAPLVQLVEARAEFLAVRQAVFDLDRRVEAHLKKRP
jgi:hypothetical protein